MSAKHTPKGISRGTTILPPIHGILLVKTDVVVVGLGIGGLCAAMRAAELGAEVIAIDKLKYFEDTSEIFSELPGGPGNATLKAGAAAAWPEEDFRTLLDFTASGITLFEEKSWGRGNLEQYKEIVKEGEYVFNNWLIKHGNMEHGMVKAGDISPDGRPYRARWTQKWLVPEAGRLGAKLMFGTKAVKLLMDPGSKRVAGVRVLDSDGLKDIKAKVVILASGGFEGDEAMKLAYLEPRPNAAYIPVTGGPQNTGDGLTMAREIGAQLVNMSWHHTRMTEPNYFGKAPCGKSYGEAVKVNLLGERVTDESEYIASKGDILIVQPTKMWKGKLVPVLWIIIDKKLYDKRRKSYEGNVENTKIERPQYDVRREEMIIQAETIMELAEKCGMNPERLRKTIDGFNAAVKADGTAPGIPHPKKKNAVKINTPPFYASPATCAINQSLGGVKTNALLQVLNTEDEVIQGLYAAGACANTHFGKYYYGPFGELDVKSSYLHGSRTAGVMGYLAGEHGAKEAKG